MGIEGKPWRFEMLGGPKLVLELSGWAAPLGGPRVEPVVRTPIKARAERVFYPGSNNSTRHVFGVMYPNWELKGRFRDRARPPMGGIGFAKKKTDEVKSFVAELQPVRITWGDIVVAQHAFLLEFNPGWEAEYEVEWTLTAEIDHLDVQPSNTGGRRNDTLPRNYTEDIVAALNAASAATLKPKLPGNIFDLLTSLVDALTGAVGQVAAIADQIETFKDATFAQLNRAQASIATLGRAARTLRETFAAIPNDALTFVDNADASIELATSQVTVEEQLINMLNETTKMERDIDLAKAGRARGSYVARTGDTWESISSITFGKPDRAVMIRDINGVAPGQNPVAGTEYLIPK